MKRTAVGFCVVAVFVIILAGCSFNLFESFDKVDVPSAAVLLDMANTDADNFVSQVQDYIDSDSITENNAGDVIAALENVYTTVPATETGQKAAILAGEISITADAATEQVVDNVIETVLDTLDAGGDIDPDTLVAAIFPSSLDQSGLTSILDNLTRAADAYQVFGANITGADEWMSGGEIGDVAQYAAVSMGVASIRAQLANSLGSEEDADAAILSAIQGGTLPSVDNPFDTSDGTVPAYEDSLANILNLAGLDL